MHVFSRRIAYILGFLVPGLSVKKLKTIKKQKQILMDRSEPTVTNIEF